MFYLLILNILFLLIIKVMMLSPFFFIGSSQSSADLLTLGLAVTNILTGLVWLTIHPKSISVVRATQLLSMVNWIANWRE
jgi:hypothetical protein